MDAVRYASPSQVTGWYLTTDLYDGDVKTMEWFITMMLFSRPDHGGLTCSGLGSMQG